MKMIFTGTFWGVLLILAGISILIKIFFHIDIPVFRVVFGLLVITFGISILTGRSFCSRQAMKSDEGQVMFGEGTLQAEAGRNKYNVIFGQAITDLSQLPAGSNIEVNTVFADNTVYIAADAAVQININTAFAQAVMPDGNSAVFGNYQFTSPAGKTATTLSKINASVVFGSLQVKYKP